ncbi:hypothetical protein GCM10023083_27800 [Streptomyces phyllanthi]
MPFVVRVQGRMMATVGIHIDVKVKRRASEVGHADAFPAVLYCSMGGALAPEGPARLPAVLRPTHSNIDAATSNAGAASGTSAQMVLPSAV